jgi:hypothetical protein
MWFPWFQKLLRESRKTQEILTQEISTVRDATESAEKKQGEMGVVIAGAIERAAASVPKYEESQRDKEYKLQRRMFWIALVATVFAAAAAGGAWYYAAIAKKQLTEMHDTYKEIQRQTYMGCLNALAAQETFIQVQRSAIDSHTAAAAAVQQAAAQIESQRAVLLVSFRAPENGQFIPRVPAVKGSIDQLGVPLVLRNDGKTTANFVLTFRGVLLGGNDKFVIKDTSQKSIKGPLPAGSQIPEKKDPTSQYNPVTYMAPVEDVNGTPIPYQSIATQDFFHGTTEVMAYGLLSYTDNWARYETTFCMQVVIMGQGTGRPPSTPNEIKCANYNKEKAEYINRPEIQPMVPSSTVDLIKCVAPTD